MAFQKFQKRHMVWIRIVSFIFVFILINLFLTTNLIQSGLTRIIFHEFYDDNQDYECVVFGESYSSYAIDPEIITEETGLYTMNAAIGGEYMMDMYYMALEMYDHMSPSVVVLDVDYQYFINIPDDENTVMSTLIYNNYPFSQRKLSFAFNKLMNKEYMATLFPWMIHRNNFKDINGIFWNKRTQEYKDYKPESVTQIDPEDEYRGRGFLYRDSSFEKIGETMAIWWNEPEVDYKDSLMYFKKMVELFRSHDTEVILISTPNPTETLLCSADEYNEIEQYFADMSEDNNLTYYNFNLIKPEKYIRTSKDYWDCDGHMYGEAAERYSRFLGNFIDEIASGQSIDVDEYLYGDIFDMKKNYKRDLKAVELQE